MEATTGIAETTIQPNATETTGKQSEVLKKLSPENFTDEDGEQRQLFTFHTNHGTPVKVVFYSPNETPFSQEVIADKQVYILGNQPKYREGSEWQEWVKKTGKDNRPGSQILNPMVFTEADLQKELLFFVESNPTNLIDMAFVLGTEDKNLRDTRMKASQRILTDRANELIDQIIATKSFDEYETPTDCSAEALLVLSLQGDQEAKNLLAENLAKLREKDEAPKANILKVLQEHTSTIREEPLKLTELVAVHLTDYLPKNTETGREVKTTFDATGWQKSRDTIHFALNHPVAPNNGGDWSKKPYGIIAPLDQMIKLNGNPEILNTIDTFFEVSPGQSLKLPGNSWMVRPGKLENGVLSKKDGTKKEIVYKSSIKTPEDVTALTEMLSERGKENLNESIYQGLIDPENYGAFWADFDIEGSLLTADEHNKLIEILGPRLNLRDIVSLLTAKGLTNTVQQVYEEAGIKEKVPESTAETVAKKIEGILISTLKETLIRQQITEMGYQNQPGGDWAWGSSWEVTSKTQKLGAELGIITAAHTHHISHEIESEFMGAWERGKGLLQSLKDGEINAPQYKHRAYQYVAENFQELSPQTRRMLYLVGAI